MKKQFYTFFLALFALTFITACDGDDDDDAEPSREELLTAEAWKGDVILINGVDPDLIPGASTYVPDPESVVITFEKDKTYIVTYKLNGTDWKQNGTWEFTSNEQKIKANFFNIASEADIEELSAKKFNVSTSVTLPNVPLPVKVEIRLVR